MWFCFDFGFARQNHEKQRQAKATFCQASAFPRKKYDLVVMIRTLVWSV